MATKKKTPSISAHRNISDRIATPTPVEIEKDRAAWIAFASAALAGRWGTVEECASYAERMMFECIRRFDA